jgi:hypothetical protein
MGRPRKGQERGRGEALNIRGLSPQGRDAVVHAARVRGATLAVYLERLVELHHRCRSLADGGDAQMQDMLAELGLATVRETD